MSNCNCLWRPKVFLLAVFLGSVLGCSFSQKEKNSHQVWLPWMTEPGQYGVQKIRVDTVAQWSPLKGSAAQLRSHVVRLDEYTLASQDVLIEYTYDPAGAILPLTRFSTEVAAIYAHMERLQKLDKDLTVPEAHTARKVYVKFLEDIGDRMIMVNNAFYDAAVDSFFVVPYTKPGLPLSVNGGVLAHEHFHSIFARLLLRPLIKASELRHKPSAKMAISDWTPHSNDLSKTLLKVFELKAFANTQTKKIEDRGRNFEGVEIFKNRFLNKTVLRGLNEGLADVWGWMYSQDPCFMGPSFEAEISSERCLTIEAEKQHLISLEELGSKYSPWLDKEAQERKAIKYGYEMGSSLARLLYLRIEERGEIKDPAALRLWAQRIVEILPTYLPHLLKVYVEDEGRVSVAQWEKMVDTLLFGPGAPSIPTGKCPLWMKRIKVTDTIENLTAKCKP